MPRGKKKRMRTSTPGFRERAQAEALKNPESHWYTDADLVPNPMFVEYYKRQGIGLKPDELDRMVEVLMTSLPISFRITGHGAFAQDLKDLLKSDFFAEIEKAGLEVPKPICWYPHPEMAWKATHDKRTVRKHPALKALQKFLVQENEQGSITRQEEVSMIPAMLLDVKPGHAVLDMCAAPGSKTGQIIEQLHADSPLDTTGLVVANDVERNRCYMLNHQMQRLNSPSVLITTYQAQSFPAFYFPKDGTHIPLGEEALAKSQAQAQARVKAEAHAKADTDTGSGGVYAGDTESGRRHKLLYDRVLADVPCSGDGTIRKNVDVMMKWKNSPAIGLHRTQINIGIRGVQCLKPGGRMVYSTCSFNPVENEACVAAIIRESESKVKLVDVSAELPGLIRSQGISTWSVMDKQGRWYDTPGEAPAGYGIAEVPSLFPPSAEEAAEMHLDYCVRVMPHYQNSGGFFVAVLEKEGDVETEAEADEDEAGPAMEIDTVTATTDAAATGSAGDDLDVAIETAAEEKKEKDERKRQKLRAEGREVEIRGVMNERSEAPYRLAYPHSAAIQLGPGVPDDRAVITAALGLKDTFPWEKIVYRGDITTQLAAEREKGKEKEKASESASSATQSQPQHQAKAEAEPVVPLEKKRGFKKLFIVCDALASIMHRSGADGVLTTTKRNEVQVIGMGLRLFEMHGAVGGRPKDWRVAQEGVGFVLPYATRHVVRIEGVDLLQMITNKDYTSRIFHLSETAQESVKGIGPGALILLVDVEDMKSWAKRPHPVFEKGEMPAGFVDHSHEGDLECAIRYDHARDARPSDMALVAWLGSVSVRLMLAPELIKKLKHMLGVPIKK